VRRVHLETFLARRAAFRQQAAVDRELPVVVEQGCREAERERRVEHPPDSLAHPPEAAHWVVAGAVVARAAAVVGQTQSARSS